MKNKKTLIILIITISLFLNFAVMTTSSASETTKTQEKTKRSNGIKEIQNNYKQIKKELDELAKKEKENKEELSKIEKDILRLNNEVNKLHENKKKNEENITRTEKYFNPRLRSFYKNGNMGALQALLSVEDVSDFVFKWNMLKIITEKDMETLSLLKENKKNLEENEKDMKIKRAMLEISKKQSEEKKSNLKLVSREKELHLKNLKNKEQELLLEEIRKDQNNTQVNTKENSFPSGSGTMLFPTPNSRRITSPFGNRFHPIKKINKFHSGIDIGAPMGADVVAALDGVVTHSGSLGGYGNVVMLSHGNNIVTLYAHNSVLLVNKGENVKRGQSISKIGSTGISTGPHLHFEVRVNGSPVNPMSYLSN